MEKIKAEASSEYYILTGSGIIDGCAGAVRAVCGGSRAVLVSDRTVYSLYGEKVKVLLENTGFDVFSYIFEPGEASKSPAVLADIWEFAAEKHITRGDMFVSLGGGVVSDITGFAAASFLRGVKTVNIPTDLMAMTDAAIGGKTAVNLRAGKNLAGVFCQPALVVCDTDFLASQPREVFSCGMAEVIKYGMIGSPELLESLKKGFDTEKNIVCCQRLKTEAVRLDERDFGTRRLLNFGHTAGHAIEKLSGRTVPHGFAVAQGMCLVTRAAVRAGKCGAGALEVLLTLLEKYSLPTKCVYPAADICRAALNDKKLENGEITLVIPERAGHCVLYKIPTGTLFSFLSGAEA